MVTGQTRIGKHGKTTELDIEELVMALSNVSRSGNCGTGIADKWINQWARLVWDNNVQ